MKTELNLMLHCGADAVERGDVSLVETPPATLTHIPIPHDRLIGEVIEALQYQSYEVVNEAHALTANGNRYFGMFQLDTREADHTIIVGIRNSHDKVFPAAIAAGSGVFVCDNLAFSGEVKIARKHTRHILRDLPHVTHRAISRLHGFYANQNKQIAAYKQYELTDDRARSLMVEGVKRGVIGCTHLPKVLEQWENPSHEEFEEPNLWRLFNAVTEVAKDWSTDQVYKRTQLLHGLCNAEVGIAP